jgi:PAS domain S-box-containing protein
LNECIDIASEYNIFVNELCKIIISSFLVKKKDSIAGKNIQFLLKENDELKNSLKEIDVKYKALTETAQDYIFIIDRKGVVEFVNVYAAGIIGKKPAQLIGLPLSKVFHPDLYKRQIGNINRVIKTGKPNSIDTKSAFAGKEVWLSTSLFPIFGNNKKVKSVLGISRDITKIKESENALKQSEERFRMLIEQAADGIFIGDPNGNLIGINSTACDLTGYSKKELLRMNMNQMFSKNEIRRKPLRYDLLVKGETVINERILTRKDKRKIVIEMNTKRMSDGTYQAIMRNVTERKRAEGILLKYQNELERLVRQRTRELETAYTKLKKENAERLKTEELIKFQLREKEILLKEIHHRVKNNMQVIISLLNLQASSIGDENMLELYRESQNRIKSMALIHEKLYQSKDLTHIDFPEYVGSLAGYLAQTYLTNSCSVEISTKAQNVPLEYDIVITLGLIVNELVSNSLKYAFEDKDHGRIEISLKKTTGNSLRLCVADDGKGFPHDIDFRNVKSLGLQLVCSLTEQISGVISMTNKVGTKFCILFPQKS